MKIRGLCNIAAALALFLAAGEAVAAQKCIDASGEAAIVNGNLPSARSEAIARARWSAVESVVGVEIRAQSLVQDMALVDDVISSKVRGFISNQKLLDEQVSDSTLKVRINACIEPEKATDAVSTLALNRSISVFLPARKPHSIDEGTLHQKSGAATTTTRTADEQDDTNYLSESLIGRLSENGYTVVDIAPTRLVDAETADKALKSGNFISLRSLLYKYFSNIMLIGKVDYSISQRKGEDIGYGAAMPFNKVTVRLNYRLVTRSPETGQYVILGTGLADAQGTAASVEDAAEKGLKTLADKMIPGVMQKLEQHIKGVTKKITVKVEGEGDVEKTLNMRATLSALPWVTDVQVVGLNEYSLKFPENSLYLANSINRLQNMKVSAYAPDRIVVTPKN